MKFYASVLVFVSVITSTWVISAAQPSATLTLPADLKQNPGDSISVPVLVSTDSTIGLAQFVIDFDSTVLSFINTRIGSDAQGFIKTAENLNLPFPPSTLNTNKNMLIQISGGGTQTFSGIDKKVLILNFVVIGSVGDTTLLAFDKGVNKTFITTSGLQDINNGALIFNDGLFKINSPPVIISIPDTTALEDSVYHYKPEVVDPDSDTLCYRLNTKPSWVAINTLAGTISGLPSNDNVGDTTVVIHVEDELGAFDTQSYTLHVVNVPPTITSIPKTKGVEDSLYYYDVESDDEGSTMTQYSAILPQWLSIDSITGEIRGIPFNDDIGDTTVMITVDDGNGGTGTQIYDLYINNINDPPSIFSLLSPANESTIDTLNPTLMWQSSEDVDVGDIVAYTIFCDKDSTFPNPIIKAELNDTTFAISGGLLKSTTFFWKVIAIDRDSTSVECNIIFKFITSSTATHIENQTSELIPKNFSIMQILSMQKL